VRKGSLTSRTLQATLWWAPWAAGFAVLAAGCHQMYWYQEGKTFAECRADHEDCWAELLKRIDWRYAGSYQYRFMENCMRERGYELIAQKDLPLDIKREGPEVPSYVPWIHAYGVAGALSSGPPSPAPDGAPLESAGLMRGPPYSLVGQHPPSRPGSTPPGP
jgi:hypothetical protein